MIVVLVTFHSYHFTSTLALILALDSFILITLVCLTVMLKVIYVIIQLIVIWVIILISSLIVFLCISIINIVNFVVWKTIFGIIINIVFVFVECFIQTIIKYLNPSRLINNFTDLSYLFILFEIVLIQRILPDIRCLRAFIVMIVSIIQFINVFDRRSIIVIIRIVIFVIWCTVWSSICIIDICLIRILLLLNVWLVSSINTFILISILII